MRLVILFVYTWY